MGAAVFLDRDGTLIDELGYLADPGALRLFPGAADAVAAWNRAGVLVVLVTNQSGVARGSFDEERLASVHARLEELLGEAGARLDLILHCPHHPTEGSAPYRRECTCRKPEPGMLLDAAARLGIDLGASWIVGDAERDLEAGRRAGVSRLLLVATGKGGATDARLREAGIDDYELVDDLAAAAERVLAWIGTKGS